MENWKKQSPIEPSPSTKLTETNNDLPKSTINYQNLAFDMEAFLVKHTMGPEKDQDPELNITDCVDADDSDAWVGGRTEYPDASERSSSFSGTVSGAEGSFSGDAEVQSRRASRKSRKKKLTKHWRSYVRSLMWPCKWIELQLKELQSQALKYDRELAEYNRTKLLDLDNIIKEGSGVKSLPFCDHSQKKKIMRRKRRHRIEDTTDLASYMSRHHAFAYCELQRHANGACANDDRGKLDKTVEGGLQVGLDGFNGDSLLEELLSKIDKAQFRVRKLRDRLSKVVEDGNVTATLRPASVSGKQVRLMCAPVIPDYDSMSDLIFPQTAILSHEDVMLLPDIPQSTCHLLVEGSPKKEGKVPKEELLTSDTEKLQPLGKHHELMEERESTDIVVPREGMSLENDQSTQRFRSISQLTTAPDKKRKRPIDKASGQWSKRSSG